MTVSSSVTHRVIGHVTTYNNECQVKSGRAFTEQDNCCRAKEPQDGSIRRSATPGREALLTLLDPGLRTNEDREGEVKKAFVIRSGRPTGQWAHPRWHRTVHLFCVLHEVLSHYASADPVPSLVGAKRYGRPTARSLAWAWDMIKLCLARSVPANQPYGTAARYAYAAVRIRRGMYCAYVTVDISTGCTTCNVLDPRCVGPLMLMSSRRPHFWFHHLACLAACTCRSISIIFWSS